MERSTQFQIFSSIPSSRCKASIYGKDFDADVLLSWRPSYPNHYGKERVALRRPLPTPRMYGFTSEQRSNLDISAVNMAREKLDEIIAKTDGEPPCLRAIDAVITHKADLIASVVVIINKNDGMAHGSIHD